MTRILLALFALLSSIAAARAEDVYQVQGRAGVTQPYYLSLPSGTPAATLVLFAGGKGTINGGRSNNFLVRTRAAFVAQGFAVALMDLPSDHPTGIGEPYRSSQAGADDAAAVIAEIRKRVPAPLWLVGTSNGTISAANVAARLKQGGPAGIVLTSSIIADTRGSQGIPGVVDVSQVSVPVIVVHNREDACPSCPFAQVEGFVARFTHAARTQLIAVTGGDPPRSGPCDALSRHGYLGIEDQVVGLIAKAIKGS